MNRARAWAAHWLPNILLNDPSIDSREDWMQWCTTYLYELLGTDRFLPLYATNIQRHRVAFN
eukprot:1855379-Pyramimonas_sp.AAC.1